MLIQEHGLRGTGGGGESEGSENSGVFLHQNLKKLFSKAVAPTSYVLHTHAVLPVLGSLSFLELLFNACLSNS